MLTTDAEMTSEVAQLQARIAELTNHADSMRLMLAFHKQAADEYRRKWAAAVAELTALNGAKP